MVEPEWYRSSTARLCTVSIQHGRSGTNRLYTRLTEHRVDWRRQQWRQLGTREPYNASIVHDRLGTLQFIAHRYDCAPCSLNTLSVVSTRHRSMVHRNDCALAIGHDSVRHKSKWAPRQLCTSTTVHRDNWGLIGNAQSIRHRLDRAPLQLMGTAGHTAKILPTLSVILLLK